ncbi:MAG: CAP domain-containing protein [Roseobacter sp.]
MKRVFFAIFVLWATHAASDPQMTQALNTLRSENSLEAVAFSAPLEVAAQRHANDMAQAGIFSHTGSDGSDVSRRVSDTGYAWCVVAENIAKGQQSLEEVMQAWAASPGHRRNMLSDEVTEFALVLGEDDIWVMVLAAPGC